MKVAILKDKEKIQIIEKDIPEVRDNEVLVKIKYCGICGSDVHGFKGEFQKFGTVMGHECSGVIEKIGKHVSGYHQNQRVAIKPFPQCGKCYLCRNGKIMVCPDGWNNSIGLSPDHDGAFAEYVLIKYPEFMIFNLPDAVSFEEGALIEPLSTSFHSFKISRFKAGDNVLVIGAGPIGLGIINFLKLGSAGKIIVMEISKKRSELAYEIGADEVINPKIDSGELSKTLNELTDGKGADIVFEAAGVPFSFTNCINFVSRGGQIIIVGFQLNEVPINPGLILLKHVEILGSLGYHDSDFSNVIEFVKRKQIRSDLFISDKISLEDIQEKGFERLLTNPEYIKILVKS